MRMKICPFLLLVALTPFFNSCQQNEGNYEKVIYSDGKEEINKKATINSQLPNGKEISIIPDEWMEYCGSKDYKSITNYYVENKEISYPKNIRINWDILEEPRYYTFLLSDNKQMDNAISYEVDGRGIVFSDLFAGTHYYYQIKATYVGKTIISKRFDFKTTDSFRTIRIGGVLNGRDLGNKKTKDGKKRVKQGLIYRTANLDFVNVSGITQATEIYKIKTDLDLREQGPTESPLGPSVNYINNGVSEKGSPYYVSQFTGVNVPEYQQAMRDNLKVFANKDNYPMVFHCAVGRDRTGTLAITLLLLLGINLDQIKQDYAVSFFSRACNPESFEAYDESMNNLFKYYERYKGGDLPDSASIYQRVEQYCLHVGLSKDEITSIREILLEDIKK